MPGPMQNLIEFYTCFDNSEKHIEGDAVNAEDAKYQIEIASAIVGGEEELRKRPIFSVVACSISPLRYDEGITEASIEFAKAGIPVVIYPMLMAGEPGPATLAGTMVVHNAEFLGSLTTIQLASPGAPIVFAADAGIPDFRTGTAIESPENDLLNLALTQLAHYYNLPCETECSCSSSKVLDTQAGYEKAISLLPLMLAKPDIILGLGVLEGVALLHLKLWS